MLSKRISTMLLSGAAAAAMTSAAQAAFMYDVRAVSVSGAGNLVVTNKSVVMVTPGVVTFNLFGLIQPATDDGNPNNEANKSMNGSFLSTGGTTVGNLAATVAAPFQNLSFSGGTIQDLDGDGDLDVGNNSSSSGADYWSARATDTTNGVAGQEALLGTMTFTVTTAGTETSVNFRKKAGAASGIGQWVENGVTILSNANNVLVGAPVLVGGIVPEPTSIGLIGLAGLGMLARRRK